ncbi:hypothetical protein BZA70DRAFT_38307 [Myxozyma melibiosi]|uniref:Integral membrane protein n=1 Tax=Myxozyma melibiosi TaxID=54550 RepID=A0ABR1FEB0_9ASCO
MKSSLTLPILALALSLSVAAHGDEPESDSPPSPATMGGMHMAPFNATEFFNSYDTTSFLNTPDSRSFLIAHIAFMILSFAILLPVSLMLSIARSPLYTPVHIIFLATTAVGLVPAVIYKSRAPDLYPGNIHSSFGWVIFFLLAIHFAAGFFSDFFGWALRKPYSARAASAASSSSVPPSPTYEPVDDRASSDSARAGSLGGETLDGHEDLYSDDYYPSEYGYRYTDGDDGSRNYVLETADDLEKLSLPHHPLTVEYRIQHAIATYFEPLRRAISRLPERALTSFYLLSTVVFSLLNRPMILIGFFQIMSGIVTATNLGMKDKIYGLLAHFIKGSIFFWFGILTFGRVLGAFAELGWAWNVRPPVARSRQGLGARIFNCSLETVESGLIFTYGITNIFMEHLGNKDGKWSHKDLQHASIAFMYIGGGLCGLLFESSSVRSLFNASIANKLPRSRTIRGVASVSAASAAVATATNASSAASAPSPASAGKPLRPVVVAGNDSCAAEPASYAASFNPFPAFTVFFTGALMSQHQQATALSTTIHMQWGYLLCIAAVFRAITYITFFQSPPSSYLPSRPFTEVLTSFCLMAGGVIFVASSEQVVNAIIYYGLDSMFTMNIAVGSVALLMAWIMVLMALKGWAVRRRS